MHYLCTTSYLFDISPGSVFLWKEKERTRCKVFFRKGARGLLQINGAGFSRPEWRMRSREIWESIDESHIFRNLNHKETKKKRIEEGEEGFILIPTERREERSAGDVWRDWEGKVAFWIVTLIGADSFVIGVSAFWPSEGNKGQKVRATRSV